MAFDGKKPESPSPWAGVFALALVMTGICVIVWLNLKY